MRYLEKGTSVWLILPDREVALAQVGSSKVYGNGITRLDLSADDAMLEVNDTTKYVGCKANPVASVAKVVAQPVEATKVEAKPEVKSAPKAEAKAEVKDTSEKGWLDSLKFWGNDETSKDTKLSQKAEAKDASEKGWFDRMKFWESNDKDKRVEPVKPAQEAKVAPVAKTPVKEDAPVAQVAEAKVAEPVKEVTESTPVAEANETKDVAAVEEIAVPQEGAEAAVAKTVEAWASAWRTKNANAYLNFYSAKFMPEGMSKAAWEAQRKQRVGANSAEIALTLDKLSIAADAKKATATFVQHYASGKYSDTVAKTLSFENVNGQWLIVKESAKAAASK
jgi:ketosteroid isomerase-like protein